MKNNTLRTIIFAIIEIITVSNIAAQPQQLSLEECRNMAIESNTIARMAELNSLKAKYTVKAVTANFLPRFKITGYYVMSNLKLEETISGGYLPTYVPAADGSLQPNLMTIGGQPVMINGEPVFNQYAYFPDITLSAKFDNAYNAGLCVEQPIFMGGKIVAGYRMSKHGAKLAAINEEYSQDDILVRTEDAYWKCIEAREMTEVAKSYHDVVAEFYRNMQNAVEVGMRTPKDLVAVQSKLNEAELNLARANNAVRLSSMNLCFVIGLPLTSDIVLTDTLDDNRTVTSTNDVDVTNRSEYRMLTEQVAMKGEEVKIVRADYLPQLAVAGYYGYTNGFQFNDTKMLDRSTLAGVVTLSIPLFHWGEGHNKIKVAKVEKELLQLQLDEAAQQMMLEVTQDANLLDESWLEVQLTSTSLKQAEQNLIDSRNRFEVGNETLADHLEAQSLWRNASADYVKALAALRLAETGYLRSIGKL